MDDFPESAMIALLPTTSDWCKIDLPHLTLVYVGEISELSQNMYNEMAKKGLALAMSCAPITLDVLALEVFGEGLDKVEVLLLRPSAEILAMRHAVEDWNGSQYHQYKPHATIGPVGSTKFDDPLPTSLTFDRIYVSWGPLNLTYKMV